MSDLASGLVTTNWLAEHLTDDKIAIVDVSWYLPDMKRDARAEFKRAHIPGAVFADLDAISHPTSPLPHMLPEPDFFAQRMSELGIGNRHKVISYDGAGLFSAARLWWMCRVFGHKNVAVLDGGFPKWQAEQRPVTDKTHPKPSAQFTATLNTEMVADAEAVLATLSKEDTQVADARGPARFLAQEPEPRPGVRGGHIPTSKNVHYKSLLQDTGELKPAGEISSVFETAGLDLKSPIITSCGSGVTAAILRLALHQVNAPNAPLYDGSWAEWGARQDLPLEK